MTKTLRGQILKKTSRASSNDPNLNLNKIFSLSAESPSAHEEAEKGSASPKKDAGLSLHNTPQKGSMTYRSKQASSNLKYFQGGKRTQITIIPTQVKKKVRHGTSLKTVSQAITQSSQISDTVQDTLKTGTFENASVQLDILQTNTDQMNPSASQEQLATGFEATDMDQINPEVSVI